MTCSRRAIRRVAIPDDNQSTSLPTGVSSSEGWLERAFPSAPHTIDVDQFGEAATDKLPLFPIRRLELLRPHGTGFREFACLADNLLLMHSDFQYEHAVEGKAEGHDYLKFHFKISGHNLVRFGGNCDYLIDAGKSVIAYHPTGLLKDDCYAARARECSLTLSCKPGALLEIMRVQPEDLPAPLCNYFRGNSNDFFCHTLPLTQEMVVTIGSILRPRYDGHLRRLHIEARSLDLICVMLDMLQETPRRDIQAQKVRVRDIEALHAVRTFLGTCYALPPSIPALSRRFGLNRTKLTEGFRMLFGQTIFGYIHAIRMQVAKQLLLESQLSIAVVAETVGYERQTSFATAFRQHYGFAPRDLKRRYRSRSTDLNAVDLPKTSSLGH